MTIVDYLVAGACAIGAAALLARSRLLRTVVVESLAHPFSKGFVVQRGDEVKVVRGMSLDDAARLSERTEAEKRTKDQPPPGGQTEPTPTASPVHQQP
jgi:hypothetical protein